jgi:hypothetical protein
VDKVQVDVEDGRLALRLGDEVLLPHFFKESFRGIHGFLLFGECVCAYEADKV